MSSFPSNSIVAFKNGFNGGTRANRFRVRPDWPNSISVTDNDSTFKMVSASLPSVQIGTISVPYRGRNITFPGDRQYGTWAIGIYDDNNTNNLWKALHKWSELMDGHYTHLVTNDDYSFAGYQTTWNIDQLDLNGNVLKTITLYKCWPSVVGDIKLDMGEPGFVGFSSTLTFDYISIDDNYNT